MAFQNVKTVDLCIGIARTVAVLICVLGTISRANAHPAEWEAGSVPALEMECLLGKPARHVALLACDDGCHPIPWQLDERGRDGDLVFEGGDLAAADDPPLTLDANDEVVFMVADGGRKAAAGELPAAPCRMAIRLRRTGSEDRRIYALGFVSEAPRTSTSYVRYDVASDTLTGDGIALGFRDRIPQHLMLADENGASVNVLDRLKVRAAARFLGLIPVSRDEGDLEAAVVGWHAGPVRIVRRQRQRIRVGWGIKSPRFTIDTYFYRRSAAIPVAFRLNFPPTYFFNAITVETVLDFRDLRGWRVLTPALPSAMAVDSLSPESLRALNQSPAAWFALIGPRVQLVQFLEVSASLDQLEKRLLFRMTQAPHPPEETPGETPGIGYALGGWGSVDRGTHAFAAVTFMLPLDQDLATFVRERAIPTQIDVLPAGEADRF